MELGIQSSLILYALPSLLSPAFGSCFLIKEFPSLLQQELSLLLRLRSPSPLSPLSSEELLFLPLISRAIAYRGQWYWWHLLLRGIGGPSVTISASPRAPTMLQGGVTGKKKKDSELLDRQGWCSVWRSKENRTELRIFTAAERQTSANAEGP